MSTLVAQSGSNLNALIEARVAGCLGLRVDHHFEGMVKER